MCIRKKYKQWRKRRRDRIYEGPCEDGGTRIRRDTDAPKEILSREPVRFSCRFSALSLQECDTGMIQGVYSFNALKGEGGVMCTVVCNNPRAIPERERKFTRSDDLMTELDTLLREHDVARYNGSYYKVSGLPDFYGATIDVEYASGETIYCYNNQDPFLPIELIRELCGLFDVPLKDLTSNT